MSDKQLPEGELIPISGPVSLLVGQRQGRFPHCHGVYLDGDEPTLVDPGCGSRVLGELRQSRPPARIINTHSHPDHTSGNAMFQGIPIWVPQQAREYAGKLDRMAVRFMGGGARGEQWKGFAQRIVGFKEYRPTDFYGPGQVWRAGGCRLEALHAPGHTPDHYCLWLPELGVLIAADIDLSPFGPWYGNEESNLAQFRASLDLVRALKPRVLVSAHMPPLSEGIDEALDVFQAAIDRREQRLLDFLARERTMREIVDASLIYGGYPWEAELLRYWEGRMIARHLDELIPQGRVEATERGYRAA